MSENVTFAVECTMSERRVPHFLAALRRMEQLGDIGSSRFVAIYADGDGDFRPKFTAHVAAVYDKAVEEIADGEITEILEGYFYDAG
jgi:hypothetical protein